VIGQFPGDIFAYLCCFEVWAWFIALFSSKFGPCFAGCDGRGDSFLFEDCANFTDCTVFEAGGGVNTVGDYGFCVGGGVGCDLGGGEFIFFFVGPVCSGSKKVRGGFL